MAKKPAEKVVKAKETAVKKKFPSAHSTAKTIQARKELNKKTMKELGL